LRHVLPGAAMPKHFVSSGVLMNKSILPCVATVFSMVCLCATAETVTPLKGQSPEIIQQDIGACQAQAGGTASTSTSPQTGGIGRAS